jgi:hypothetical protein
MVQGLDMRFLAKKHKNDVRGIRVIDEWFHQYHWKVSGLVLRQMQVGGGGWEGPW